jgi:hypothetical protein
MVFITLPLPSWNTVGGGGVTRPSPALPARNSGDGGADAASLVGVDLRELTDRFDGGLGIALVLQERAAEPL